MPLRHLPLLLIALAQVGCGGGGHASIPDPNPNPNPNPGPPDPPHVTGVVGPATVGDSGMQVSFTSNVTGTVTRWTWDFGGGATLLGTSAATVSAVLGNPGSYQGHLTACNGADCDTPFEFSFAVHDPHALPVVTQVNHSGRVGFTAQALNFIATVTNSVTSFTWDFGGAGAPNASTDPIPLLTLRAAGDYTATVIAHNAYGDSAPFTFPLHVDAASTWPSAYVDESTTDLSTQASIGLYGDRPVLAVTGTDGVLALALSQVTTPTHETDWTVTQIDARPCYDPVLAVIDGRCAILYRAGAVPGEGAGQLAFAICDQVAPASPTTWTITDLGSVAGWQSTSLVGDSTGLLITFTDSIQKRLWVSATQTPHPVHLADWTTLSLDRWASDQQGISSTIWRGRRVVIYKWSDGSLRSAITNPGANPTGFSSWNLGIVNAKGESENYGDYAASVDGASDPLVVATAADGILKLEIAESDQPQSPTDWREVPIDPVIGEVELDFGTQAPPRAFGPVLFARDAQRIAVSYGVPVISEDCVYSTRNMVAATTGGLLAPRQEWVLTPVGSSITVCGNSGGGSSTWADGLIPTSTGFSYLASDDNWQKSLQWVSVPMAP